MIKNYHTAIVTGASHGIGPFIVSTLAKEGMNLVLAARSGQELEQVAAGIRATGVQVLCVPTDVTDPDSRSALVAAAERIFGSVDILVNNAGGDPQRGGPAAAGFVFRFRAACRIRTRLRAIRDRYRGVSCRGS